MSKKVKEAPNGAKLKTNWCPEVVMGELFRSRNEGVISSIHKSATKLFAHLASDEAEFPVKQEYKNTTTYAEFGDFLADSYTAGHLYMFRHKAEFIIVHFGFGLIDHLTSLRYGASKYEPKVDSRVRAGWFDKKMVEAITNNFNNSYPKIWQNELGFSPVPDGFLDTNKIPFDMDTKVFVLENTITIDGCEYPLEFVFSDTLAEYLNQYKETSTKSDNIARLEAVELDLKAVVMSTKMSIAELELLTVGSIIPVNQVSTVEIQVDDGTVLAIGEIGRYESSRAIKIK